MVGKKWVLFTGVLSVVLSFVILCTLPEDPNDPLNTSAGIILRTSQWKTSSSSITDSTGNVIQVGAALFLPEYIDSVNLRIAAGDGKIVFDSTFRVFLATKRDTAWKSIIFYSAGNKTVTLTPYSSTVAFNPVTAIISIIDKGLPLNHKPMMSVTGNTVLRPTETCSLALQISDVDEGQDPTVSMFGFPVGAVLQNNTHFIWSVPADYIGSDTVLFVTTDNGAPPLSDTTRVVIIVTATPNRPQIKIVGDRSVMPLETCSLVVRVSDDDPGQQLTITMSGEPAGALLVYDSVFIWTVPADFAGETSVAFTVVDNGVPPLSNSTQVIITVSTKSTNTAPKWDVARLPAAINDTSTFELDLPDICIDADGDEIVFSLLSGLPPDDTIIGFTYSFSAKPAAIGSYNVRIVASDPVGANDTLIINLSVTSSSAVDTTPPSLQLVSPVDDNITVYTPTCLIDVISSDLSGVASVTATFNETTISLQPASGHYTVTIEGLKAGENNKIELVATDASPVGNKNVKAVYIKYSLGITLKYDGNGNTGGKVPVDTASYQTGAQATVKPNTDNLVKTGSTFTGWNTKDDGSGLSYAPAATITLGASSVTLYAVWTQKVTYQLTISATNGSVTKTPDLAAYDSGTVVTLTPVPAADYHFSGWSGAATGSVSPGTVVMDGPKSVTAIFEINLPNSFALTTSATNGSVTKTPDLPQYDSGTVVNLTAVPAAGYQFTGWSGGLTGTTNPTSITMTGAKSVTANFAIKTYALSTSATNGSVTKTPDLPQYDSGTVVNLTAVPAAGYKFTGWSGGLTGTTNPTSITMTGAKSVTAGFVGLTFEKVIAVTDQFRGVKQLADGGYIITGNQNMVRLDANGTQVFSKAYDNDGYGGTGFSANSINVLTDGGYVVAGSANIFSDDDIYLMRFYANGNRQWYNHFGGTYQEIGTFAIQTSDGGFLTGGTSSSFGTNNNDYYIVKTNASGVSSWTQYYDGGGVERLNDGIATGDGYLLVGGANIGSNIWVVKVNISGTKVWDYYYKAVSGSSCCGGMLYSVRACSGGYIISGSTTTGASLLLKINSSGTLLWSQNYPNSSSIYAVRETGDGGFIFVASTTAIGNSGSNVYLAKTNSAGTLSWESGLGGNLDEFGFSVERTQDGGYVVVGTSDSKCYIIKTDENGQVSP